MKISIKYARRAVQAGAVVVLMLPLFFQNTIWFGTYISADFWGLALTDPFTVLEISAAGRHFGGPLIFSTVPLLIAAGLLGRVFCSFICPLNFLLEVLPVRKKANRQWKIGPILLIPILVSFSGIAELPVFTMLSPLTILMRVLLFGLGVEAVILVIVLVGEWFYGYKFWCRNVCPQGALYGLVGIKRCITVSVDEDRCTGCKACVKACSMGIIPGSGKLLDRVSCTNCGDCIDACSTKAITYSLFTNNKQKREVNNNEAVDGITRNEIYH